MYASNKCLWLNCIINIIYFLSDLHFVSDVKMSDTNIVIPTILWYYLKLGLEATAEAVFKPGKKKEMKQSLTVLIQNWFQRYGAFFFFTFTLKQSPKEDATIS